MNGNQGKRSLRHALAVNGTIGMDKQKVAHSIVYRAVRKGVLKKLDGTVPCADCGDVAVHYDHRDYKKPLEVSPVCAICNHARGHANEFKPLKKRRPSGYKKMNRCKLCGRIVRRKNKSGPQPKYCTNLHAQYAKIERMAERIREKKWK